MGDNPTIIGSRHDLVAFDHGRLVVIVPRTPYGFEETAHYLRAQYDAIGQTLVLVVLIQPAQMRPDAGLAKRAYALIGQVGACLDSVTMVVSGTGFFASMFISAAAGMVLLLRRSGPPTRLLGSLPEAAKWVTRRLDDRAVVLDDVVEQFEIDVGIAETIPVRSEDASISPH